MTLNKARILSSENNSSMTNNQHQTTNVNIKFPDIKKAQTRDIQLTQEPPAGYMDVPIYPSVSASTLTNINQAAEQELTEKAAEQELTEKEKQLLEENTQLQNQLQTREIELTESLDDLETKNKFLELLLQVYEDNPIKINSYLICKSSILMEMIKLL